MQFYQDPLYATSIAFDIVKVEEFNAPGFNYEDNQKQSLTGLRIDRWQDFTGVVGKIPPDGTRIKREDERNLRVRPPPYNFGSTQQECYLEAGVDYFIVPSMWKRGQPGDFFVQVFSEVDFDLDGSVQLTGEHDVMVIGTSPVSGAAVPGITAIPTIVKSVGAEAVVPKEIQPAASSAAGLTAVLKVEQSPATAKAAAVAIGVNKALPMSKAQFFEKQEQLRERLVAEAKRHNITLQGMRAAFKADLLNEEKSEQDNSSEDEDKTTGKGRASKKPMGQPNFLPGLTPPEFKRRMMELGFRLG